MLLTLPQVLEPALLDRIRARLDELPHVAGKRSAGLDAVRVKNNLEADPADPRIAELNRWVLLPLYRHPEFQAAALPRRLSGAFFAQYQPGMEYGLHVDDPVMGPEGAQYRTDISITVFLNSAADYTGGELEIETTFGPQQVKLNAGDVVIYPSSSLHRVKPVQQGLRQVAVAWAESMVRDPEQRQLLYQLHQLETQLRNTDPDAPTTRQAAQIRANLTRRWASV